MENNVLHVDKTLSQGNQTYLEKDDPSNTSGMGFSVLTLMERQRATTQGESAFVLLSGKGTFTFGEKHIEVERTSLFDENPHTFLLPPGHEYEIIPSGTMEWAVISTGESALREPKVFMPDEVSVERRGIGLLDNTSYRLVKCVFDHSTLPESNLVIGEVVNQPGRWSSYPPHHHPQPELYFYRFLPQQGYGFSQLGERVVKVKQNSLVIIEGVDHPQVAAPGYAMWYLWVVRHLPGNPYTGFEFDKAHEWTMDEKAKVWSLDDQ